MPGLPFRKLHGCRNDYVVVGAADLAGGPGQADTPSWAAQVVALCDRRQGVGADGLLLVGSAPGADLSMRMWNPDGSEAEMCGNGLRCAIRFAFERAGRPAVGRGVVRTAVGGLAFEVHGAVGADWDVEIQVGTPHYVGGLRVAVPDVDVTRITLGNPHAVVFVDDVEAVPVATWGPALEHHGAFPHRTNVEFVSVMARDHLVQRTWERGAGETLACGTGAAAAWVAAARAGHVDEEGRVELRGGTLHMRWPGSGPVYLRGPATAVFDGVWGAGHGDV